MIRLLQSLGAFFLGEPDSWDDYWSFGRWFIYKRFAILLLVLLLMLSVFLLIWAFRPEKEPEIPVFYLDEDRLKLYSGEAILKQREPDIVVYRGPVAGGLRSGWGKELRAGVSGEELVYEGEFQHNTYHGQGTLYREGLRLYEGSFRNGQFDGSGILYEKEQVLYTGGFSEGMYSSEGRLYDNQGQLVYQGGFRFGLYEGQGRLYQQGKLRYTGGFVQGLPEGEGLELEEDGSTRYEGGFRNGLYDGQGILYQNGGVRLKYEGQFVQGVLNREGRIYNLRGQLLYDGPIYQGKADLLGLIGRFITEAEEIIRETPVVYYGEGMAGYLYRQLGFALLFRYDYTELEADPQPPGLELFFQPPDNLVIQELLIPLEQLDGFSPGSGTALLYLSGFEEFLASRVAGISGPSAALRTKEELLRRGEHLYEVAGLPEISETPASGLIWEELLFFTPDASETDRQKGSFPEILLIRRLDLGG